MKPATLIFGGIVGIAVLVGLTKGAGATPAGTAHITATAQDPLSKTSCCGPCTVSGGYTWTNDGDIAGTFTPSISLDGVSQAIAAAQTLEPGASVHVTFSVDISKETTILPVPN